MIFIIYNNILETIGNTPIVKLTKVQNYYNLNFNLYAKIEYFNPFGSIKDRICINMIESLIKEKAINNDTIIIEATSGNTGIGLAHVCNYYNLKLIIIISKKMSIERINLLQALKAKTILVEDIKEGILLAKKLNKRLENSFYISQFTNIKNYQTHYTTAKEILRDIPNIDYALLGIGSGGTITGISKYLKRVNKNTVIYGVEPENNPFLTLNKTGNSKINGIGTTFFPKILNLTYTDKILLANEENSFEMCNKLIILEGLFVGFSSGSLLSVVIKNKELFKKSSNVLLIFPDNGYKYISLNKF